MEGAERNESNLRFQASTRRNVRRRAVAAAEFTVRFGPHGFIRGLPSASVRPRDTPPEVTAKTRLDCDRTSGYNVRPGARYYEFCPFCGHRTDGEEHAVVVEFDD